MSKNTMYAATFFACNELTTTFDMIWPLDGALWRFKKEIGEYISAHPNESETQLKALFFPDKYIHGINFHRTACELPWESQEQYIAKLLLVNITAIYDSWVDCIIKTGLPNTISNKQKKEIAAGMKRGDISSLETEISVAPTSVYAGCFKKHDTLSSLLLSSSVICYKYFKSCRNCCAHGDLNFSHQAERDYILYAALTKENLGVSEKPIALQTVDGQPFKLSLRGVVGFTQVLYNIIMHYDSILSNNTCIEEEIIERWRVANPDPLDLIVRRDKRNASLRNNFIEFNMCPPYANKTDEIYAFLHSKALVN